MLHEYFSSPLDFKTVKQRKDYIEPSQAEKKAVAAEKHFTANRINNQNILKEIWIDIFNEKYENALAVLKETAAGDFKNTVKINSDGAELNILKFAEDNSGDVIMRIEETKGEEKPITVMCDEFNAGFKCEINPYEIITFRIDSEGFVEETFVTE